MARSAHGYTNAITAGYDYVHRDRDPAAIKASEKRRKAKAKK